MTGDTDLDNGAGRSRRPWSEGRGWWRSRPPLAVQFRRSVADWPRILRDRAFGTRDGRLFCAMVAFVVVCALLVDRPVAQWARALPDEIRAAFAAITYWGRSDPWLVFTVFFGGLAAWVLHQRLWALRALYVFLAVAVSGIAVNVVKLVVGRARPRLLFADDPSYGVAPFGGVGAWTSFPSGHTSTAVAMALCLSTFFPRLWPLWWGGASLVALSRVVVGAHFPSDLIGGLYVTWLVVRWLDGRFARKGVVLEVRRDERP